MQVQQPVQRQAETQYRAQQAKTPEQLAGWVCRKFHRSGCRRKFPFRIWDKTCSFLLYVDGWGVQPAQAVGDRLLFFFFVTICFQLVLDALRVWVTL